MLGRRDRPVDLGLPLPARHEQVEQDRAQAVQLHRPQLARPAVGLPTECRVTHRRDHLDAGLKVYAQLDENAYPRAIKVPDAELAAVSRALDAFHGEWNYTIKPQGC